MIRRKRKDHEDRRKNDQKMKNTYKGMEKIEEQIIRKHSDGGEKK